MRLTDRSYVHGGVFESGDIVGKLTGESGRYFAFLSNATTGLPANL